MESSIHNPTTSTPSHNQQSKRIYCARCKFPKPQTCICSALPFASSEEEEEGEHKNHKLNFSHCRILVLQHPLEQKRKNRSVPLISLCVNEYNTTTTTTTTRYTDHNHTTTASIDGLPSSSSFDFQFKVIIGKRLGHQTDPNIMNFIHDPFNPVWLVYPSPDAIPLQDAISSSLLSLQRQNDNDDDDDDDNEPEIQTQITTSHLPKKYYNQKITLIFLDATWKYANEMDKACIQHDTWPKHMIRVQLSPFTNTTTTKSSNNNNNNDNSYSNSNENDDSFNYLLLQQFKPKRFHIRTPPSENHLSTAECIAFTVSMIEGRMMSKIKNYHTNKDTTSNTNNNRSNGSDISTHIYETLMKPLDLMVQKWHDCTTSSNKPTATAADSTVISS